MEILSIFSDTLLHMSSGLVGILAGAFFLNRRKAKKQKERDKLRNEIRKEVIEEMTASAKAGEPRPGSDAHYAAWREEQRKKTGKE